MDQLYTGKLEKIEKTLERWLPGSPDQEWMAEVFPGLEDQPAARLAQTLLAPGRDLFSRGGKRWRPLLMTLVCEALGGGDTALPLTPLVELCHNASLIHDDIEDNSDERRGKPAVHIVYGVDAAINSGSFLYFLPLACIDSWAAELESGMGFSYAAAQACRAQVYALWAQSLRKLHLGQAIDIHWHRNFDIIPAIEDYYTMCKLKTGCLSRFAAELGTTAAELTGIAAGPADSDFDPLKQLGEAAEKLGVGYQILDDVKNLTTGLPGKKRGDDIVEGKKSLPVLLFLNRLPEQKETVQRCFRAARSGGAGANEVEELIQAFSSAGVLAEAGERGKALIAEARDAFTGIERAFRVSVNESGLLSGLIDQIT